MSVETGLVLFLLVAGWALLRPWKAERERDLPGRRAGGGGSASPDAGAWGGDGCSGGDGCGGGGGE